MFQLDDVILTPPPPPHSFETTRLLVSLGSDVRSRDKHGNTALHHSATNLNYAATKVLLDANAPVEVKNNDVRMMSLPLYVYTCTLMTMM